MAYRVVLNLSTPEAQLVKAALMTEREKVKDIAPTVGDCQRTLLVIDSITRDIDRQLAIEKVRKQ